MANWWRWLWMWALAFLQICRALSCQRLSCCILKDISSGYLCRPVFLSVDHFYPPNLRDTHFSKCSKEKTKRRTSFGNRGSESLVLSENKVPACGLFTCDLLTCISKHILEASQVFSPSGALLWSVPRFTRSKTLDVRWQSAQKEAEFIKCP